jgi:hypothetical protein
MDTNSQQDINLEIRKRKFKWIGHTLRKEDGEYPRPPYCGILRETGRVEDQSLVEEDLLSKKHREAVMNSGS